MCSGTSLSSSESLVTFSFVEDPRLDEKEIGRGTSQEGFWDSGKMLVDWINRTAIVVVTNNREVEKMFLLPLLSSLLVYYTTLKYLINVHNGKPFHLARKEGQFDVVQPTFSINLNAQHVNGMTHFDLTGGKLVKKNTCTVIRYSKYHEIRTVFSEKKYNNSWLSPSIYGGEILRQASLRSCPNGFSLSNCLKTHQEDEKLSHVKNVATWPCTSNLTNWTTGHRMSTPTSKVGDWED